MKKLFVIIFILLTSICHAQKMFEICFNNCFILPYEIDMTGFKIVESENGNGSLSIILPGSYYNSFGPNFFLTRIDSLGVEIWNKEIKADPNEIHIHNINDTDIIINQVPLDILSSPNKGYFISNTEHSFITVTDSSGIVSYFLTSPFIVTHLDSTGSIIWSKMIDLPKPVSIAKMFYNTDENALYTFASADTTCYLIKMDSIGTIIWTQEYQGISESIQTLDLMINNNKIFMSLNFKTHFDLFQTDTSGNITWSNNYDQGGDKQLVSLLKFNYGCALGINRKISPRPIIALLDSNGYVLNAKSFSRDSSTNLGLFISYGPNKFLMHQYSDSVCSSGYYHKNDIWITNSLNNFELHENLNEIQHISGTYSYGGSDILNLIKNKSGLLALYQDWHYTHVPSWFSYLPRIKQMDSIAGTCYSQPKVISNHTILNETINSTPILLSNQIITVVTLNSTLISYDSLLTSWLTCTGNVGITDVSNKPEPLKIFPNPFDNYTTISIEQEFILQNSELKIYNSIGEQVKHQPLHDIETIIYRDELSDGIYFIQVSNNKGQILSAKLLIQ